MTSPWEIHSSRAPESLRDRSAAAAELRRIGDSFARSAKRFPNHLKWLAVNGYTREDSRQIRYIVETFYSKLGSVPNLTLAPWPGYLAKLQADLSEHSAEHARAARAIEDRARELAAEGCLGIPECVSDLRAFCEDTALVCLLRRMFIRAEIAARREHLCVASGVAGPPQHPELVEGCAGAAAY